ncbi:MAG: HAMP domain-containing methyl-accepting chemotaxis protein [Chloroflexota bacterium]
MLSWFNNLRMGTKLIGAFLGLVLLVSIILGGLGYYNLNNVNQIILEITDQRVPSVKNATAVERYALRTILDEKMYLLAVNDVNKDVAVSQKSAMSNIDEINKALDEVDKVAKAYNDQDLLKKSQDVRTVTAQYKTLYNESAASTQQNKTMAQTMGDTGTKVTDLAKAYFLEVSGKTDEQSLKQVPIVVDIWDTALQTRINQNKYMLYRDKQFYTALQDGITKLGTRYADLKNVTTDAAGLQKIADATTATNDYYKAAQDWVANDDKLQTNLVKMADIGTQVQQNAVAAEDAGWTAAEASKEKGNGIVSQAITITIASMVIAILLGLVLGIVISRSITGALSVVVNAAKALSVGDLQRNLSDKVKDVVRLRKDEIGDIGKAFDSLINYMQEMGEVANRAASNDLTVSITAKSAQDELGTAFVKMIASLRNSVSQVAESAKNVSMASMQLSNAANQAGQAVTQIATTIQQVAKGTAQQTEGITRTAHSVEEMARAIDGVAKGAQEQAQAVAQSSTITTQLSKAIQQVAGNAQAVSRDSNTAAQAARSGAVTVEDTIKGMQSIKQKVGVSTQKVQEMGIRSEEIGTIVVAIEDIASQTNLLALNAAIEAARAGEHGKGFSVVADEVRKLAERASSATKEIGGLIKGIQKTVAEAVKAMEEGDREVESGVVYANQAGQVLKDILVAAEAVNQQAEQAAAASEQMSASADELVKAVDSVSAVVEENTASTEEMAAGSSEVTHAIENVASISEENSAAAEEVSASAEEMSAQVEEVSASAQSLAEMAETLQKVVEQFKL